MAAAMGFNTSIFGDSMWSKKAAKYFLHALSVNRSCQIQQPDIKMMSQLTYMKGVIKRRPMKLFVTPRSDSITDTGSRSPAQTIMLFYSAINDKNLKKLDKLIAEDCFFEDYTFPKPFQGKKEVLHFLQQLALCMGQNMQFNVEHICEGNDYTAGVNWHLDWKKIQVPFTRGCSYYTLSIDGAKLVIKKAKVLIESPIKLGVVALTIFKIVSLLFDAFPAATEWFLKSPHIVVKLLLKTYSTYIQPIISPFLAWYIKLLSFAACILSVILKVLYYLTKIFRT